MFSNDIAPEMLMLPLGPVAWTAGARFTAASSVRVVGSAASVSALMLVAAWTVLAKASVRAVTLTTSLSDAGRIVTSITTGCVAATSRVSFTVPKPLSSNVTVYCPGGSDGRMKSPFVDVVAVRTPCRLGDTTVTITPGTGRLPVSTTRPEMLPVGVCGNAGAASDARLKRTKANKRSVFRLSI